MKDQYYCKAMQKIQSHSFSGFLVICIQLVVYTIKSQEAVDSRDYYKISKMNPLGYHQLASQSLMNQWTSFAERCIGLKDRVHTSSRKYMFETKKTMTYFKKSEFDLGKTTAHH